MNTCSGRLWITVTLAAFLGAGCSDDSSTSKVGPALQQTGKDVVETTKEVGAKIGDGLAEAAESLEKFAKSAASNVSDTGEAVARSFKAKMPDVETLVEKTKDGLKAGGAEAKELASRLDDKLAVLKTRLEKLAKDGANATKEVKDDVVDAFNELIADVKTGLAKLRA